MKCVKPQGDTTNKIVRSPHTCPLHLAKKRRHHSIFWVSFSQQAIKKSSNFFFADSPQPTMRTCNTVQVFGQALRILIYIRFFIPISYVIASATHLKRTLGSPFILSVVQRRKRWSNLGCERWVEYLGTAKMFLLIFRTRQEIDWLKCYVKSCTDVSSLAIA